MRPKFRVWSKRRKGWLSPDDSSLHCHSNWMMDIFTGEIIDFTQVDNEYHRDPEPKYFIDGPVITTERPFVVQQWVGLVDKNDVDIYDGDFVKYSIGERQYIDQVRWMHYGWVLHSDMGTYGISSAYELTVIGNNFENPELLNTKA